MELFGKLFSPISIYDTLFFNFKTVLKYNSLERLCEENKLIYDSLMSSDGFNIEKNIFNFHELLRIVSITYGMVSLKNGKLERKILDITNEDESLNIITFVDILNQLDEKKDFSLCGYNISNFEIPLLIKKILFYKKELENNTLPPILKKSLDSKPWDSNILDTAIVWKFNGIDNSKSLDLIAYNLNLDNKTRILSNREISDYYWENVTIDYNKTMNYIKKQSGIITNMSINILKELRDL